MTNKCIDGYCIFNKENPTEFCTYIYSHSIFGSHSHIHCGKQVSDICKTNEECASEKCSKYGFCRAPPDGPSDSDGFNDIGKFIFFFIKILLFFIIFFTIYLIIRMCINFFLIIRMCINSKKENRNNDKTK